MEEVSPRCKQSPEIEKRPKFSGVFIINPNHFL